MKKAAYFRRQEFRANLARSESKASGSSTLLKLGNLGACFF